MNLKFFQVSTKLLIKPSAFYNSNSPVFSSREREISKTHCKSKILLVEDEVGFQCLHKTALKKMGYDLDLAENGQDAINLFQQNTYDLILLDIGLPDMSGIEVGRFIRAHNKGKSVPILALTGYGKQVEPECLAVGFDEVLSKPIKLKELETILKDRLRQSLRTSSQ